MSDIADITVILDKSSSMAGDVPETISGFNNFLKDQREEEGEARMTLVQFSDSDKIEVVYEDRDVEDAPMLDKSVYVPSGYTALFDAIAKGISLGRARSANSPLDRDRIYVIITDGEENDSEEYDKDNPDAIKELISDERDNGNEFIFLGAAEGVDAFDTAESMGIDSGKTMSYTQSDEDTYESTYEAASNLTSRTRSADTQEEMMSASFNADERKQTGGDNPTDEDLLEDVKEEFMSQAADDLDSTVGEDDNSE